MFKACPLAEAKMRYKNKTSPDLMHLGIGEDGFGSQMKNIRLKGRKKITKRQVIAESDKQSQSR